MTSAIKAGDKEAQQFFTRWQSEVVAAVPPERLLVFEAKEGWEPLCKFLGVPVPTDGPYPRSNDTNEYRNAIGKLRTYAYILVAVIFVLPILVVIPIVFWAVGVF